MVLYKGGWPSTISVSKVRAFGHQTWQIGQKSISRRTKFVFDSFHIRRFLRHWVNIFFRRLFDVGLIELFQYYLNTVSLISLADSCLWWCQAWDCESVELRRVVHPFSIHQGGSVLSIECSRYLKYSTILQAKSSETSSFSITPLHLVELIPSTISI